MSSQDPNFFDISMFLYIRFDRTELCFIAFEWLCMVYLMHFNVFYEFGSIESNSKNIEILKKFDSVGSNKFKLIRLNSIRFDRTELIKIIQMHQIHHVKSFKCNKTEFGSIEPSSKKHRNIEKVRIPRTHV